MPPPLEKKKKKAPGQVELEFKNDDFRVIFTFNKAGIEPLPSGDLLIHLGMVNVSGQLAAFAFVLEQTHLEQNVDSWTTYLERTGGPTGNGDLSFRATPSLLQHSFLPTVNFLFWHRTGSMGEMRALLFSLADVAEAAKSGEPSVRATAIALLRCPLELQLQLLFRILTYVKTGEN
jgi:hypothetical protein